MQRAALVATAALVMALTACQNKSQQTEARMDEPYVPLEKMEAAPAGDQYVSGDAGAESARWDTSTAAYEQPASDDEVLDPAGGRTYVVRKGDTLYQLARRFYSDERRWRDIWEANRTRVPDKNVLPIGTRLIIP